MRSTRAKRPWPGFPSPRRVNRQGGPRSMLERIRTSPIVMPPERWRLWLGLAVAVVGPLLSTALIRVGPLGSRPGVAFLLSVVARDGVRAPPRCRGRDPALARAPAAIRPGPDVSATVRSEQDLWSALAFGLVSCTVVLMVTRRDAARDVATAERRRFQLLVRAGDALSESLDIDETLRRLGRRAGARARRLVLRRSGPGRPVPATPS